MESLVFGARPSSQHCMWQLITPLHPPNCPKGNAGFYSLPKEKPVSQMGGAHAPKGPQLKSAGAAAARRSDLSCPCAYLPPHYAPQKEHHLKTAGLHLTADCSCFVRGLNRGSPTYSDSEGSDLEPERRRCLWHADNSINLPQAWEPQRGSMLGYTHLPTASPVALKVLFTPQRHPEKLEPCTGRGICKSERRCEWRPPFTTHCCTTGSGGPGTGPTDGCLGAWGPSEVQVKPLLHL